MYVAETFMHIKQGLDAGEKMILDDKLRQVPGVIAPWFHPERDRVMLIYYNPVKTSAVALLAQVKALGYQARMFYL